MILDLIQLWSIFGATFGISTVIIITPQEIRYFSKKQKAFLTFVCGPIVWILIPAIILFQFIWKKLE